MTVKWSASSAGIRYSLTVPSPFSSANLPSQRFARSRTGGDDDATARKKGKAMLNVMKAEKALDQIKQDGRISAEEFQRLAMPNLLMPQRQR